MNETNPYQSPSTVAAEEPLRRWPFDIGKFVGRYLQGLGVFSVGSMLVSAIFYNTLHINLLVIFYFVAGAYLVGHNQVARWLVIGVTGLAFLAVLGTTIGFLALGERWMHDTYISFGSQRLDNPPLAMVLGISALFLFLTGLPCFLLLTPQARAEFRQGGSPS